jgi:hypothetical protein
VSCTTKPPTRSRLRYVVRTCASIATWLCVAAGCRSLDGVKHCNRVISQINAELERATELHEAAPTSATYRDLAELFDKLESDLSEQTIPDELSRAVKGYAKQLRKVGREARNYSQALERLERAQESSNADQERKAQTELTQIRERAERLVESAHNDARKVHNACKPRG